MWDGKLMNDGLAKFREEFSLDEDVYEDKSKKNNKKHNKIDKIIKKLNNSYKKVDVKIKHSDKKMYIITKKNNKEEIKKLCNFFIMPKYKFRKTDEEGNSIEGFGLEVYILGKDEEVKNKLIEVTNDELENEKWINKYLENYYILFESKNYNILKNAIKISCELLKEEDKKIYSNVIGWVKGINEWHYVPISYFDNEKDLIYDRDKFEVDYLKKYDDDDVIESYNKCIEMINILDKQITIPILSYTILSSNFSLIKNRDIIPNVYLNMYGQNNKITNIEIANLFTNIFNRKNFIDKLDYNKHLRISQSENEILERVSRMRDCIVVISGIDCNDSEHRRKIEKVIKKANEKNCSSGLIFLSNSNMDLDSIINIDTTNTLFSEEILKKCINNPNSFLQFYSSIINRFKMRFTNRKYYDYKDLHEEMCEELINNGLEENFDKVNQMGWLLVGYNFILKHKFNIKKNVYLGDSKKINAIKAKEKRYEMLNDAADVLISLAYDLKSKEVIEDSGELNKYAEFYKCALKELIKTNKISDSYDEYKKDESSIGWSDDEYYFFKLDKVKVYIEGYLHKANIKSFKDTNRIYEYLYKIEFIDGQYENGKTRFRPDCKLTKMYEYKRALKMFKIPIE